MKKTLAKTLRSALALVLALVMVLGTVGTTFAAAPSVDPESAVAKLVEVLKQYGPDVVAEAREYADSHGYVKAVKETATALKTALVECAAEHETLVAIVEKQLEGPKAQLAELKDLAENLVFLIALYKAGAGADASAAGNGSNLPGVSSSVFAPDAAFGSFGRTAGCAKTQADGAVCQRWSGCGGAGLDCDVPVRCAALCHLRRYSPFCRCVF